MGEWLRRWRKLKQVMPTDQRDWTMGVVFTFLGMLLYYLMGRL